MGAEAPTAVITYQTEPLSDSLWGELAPLLSAHWREVAHYRDLELAPNREAYANLDRAKMLRVYTARAEGRLIGYLACVVAPSLHYAPHRFATQDVLYVDPAHRGARFGFMLIGYVHRQLRAEGVTLLMQHGKHRSDLNIGPLLHRLGYEHVDDLWAIRLDGE